jgi:hypothetical protein
VFARRSGGTPRHLVWRIRLLGLGAVLAITGMGTGLDWLVNVAIGVLILGFGLRFLPVASDEGDAPDGE